MCSFVFHLVFFSNIDDDLNMYAIYCIEISIHCNFFVFFQFFSLSIWMHKIECIHFKHRYVKCMTNYKTFLNYLEISLYFIIIYAIHRASFMKSVVNRIAGNLFLNLFQINFFDLFIFCIKKTSKHLGENKHHIFSSCNNFHVAQNNKMRKLFCSWINSTRNQGKWEFGSVSITSFCVRLQNFWVGLIVNFSIDIFFYSSLFWNRV